ncbi:flagellar hook-associated protein FlgK [Massilia aerilata]|uniref:Flagellar hook-associated protein 1 n=1 Tax=Massilia aerilata TaxID=453817 RepID=A0ABW0RWG4_9BURK
MSLLSIGKSGLFAAQAALSTTGHNITNANVPGFSRQGVIQETATSSGGGNAFYGNGTQIGQVKRYSDEFLNAQVRNAQAATSGLEAYQAQVSQIDNMLSDATSGLSPALQDMFAAVQNLTGDKAGLPSRGALMSAADTLAARFQGMNDQLEEMRKGVNSELSSGVGLVNSYASQIADLNDQIGKLVGNSSTSLPNDLLDKRDQLVMDLSKQIKTTVVPGDNNSLTVSIGTGQPLVVGTHAYQLVAEGSPTDQTRVSIGYVTNGKSVPLAESALTGGAIGGLLEFRSKSLDTAQNALGRIAIGLAASFNDQHHLGVDANGNPGGDFFTILPAEVTKDIRNNLTSTTTVAATVRDATQLTTSDYKVSFDGAKYSVTRLSDNKNTVISPFPQSEPQLIDGLDFAIAGKAAAGDNYLVRPTVNGAANFKLALTDASQIAAAAPTATSIATSNKGSAKIGAGAIDKSYLVSPMGSPLKLSYSGATGTLSGFPAKEAVTMTAGGVTTAYPPGAAVPFADGASYAVGGYEFTLGGAPADGAVLQVGTPSPLKLSYDGATGSLAGFPAALPVSVTIGGVTTRYAAGDSVPFKDGASYAVGGMSFSMTGAPLDKDSFSIQTGSGDGDTRNAGLLGDLQTKNIFDGGKTTYQSAYAQLVGTVGNKTREVQVNAESSGALLEQVQNAAQNVSGVNLDEEAANLLKYQQAYQAAGKVMQIADSIFNTLLQIAQ